VTDQLEREVFHRAGDRCEYCHVPRFAYATPFQVDHVIARQHGGATVSANLALACYHCNLHKGPNIASLDPPGTGSLTRLFNPRSDAWADHFDWAGAAVVGLTPTGRATVLVLNMNDPLAVAVRESLMAEGVVLD
jgi:hypothetical protein